MPAARTGGVDLRPRSAGTGSPPARRGVPVAGNFLSTLADQTGGRVLVARSERDLERVFRDIVGESRHRYLIRYYPEDVTNSGWHEIDVRLKGRRGTVQARKGYFAD
jgi:VWFA-related protein